jgi:AcrR family transcriptional regulator
MKIQLQISMNNKLYLRDPSESELGKKIISHSISLIKEKGFEDFTFKKLAKSMGSTEAGIYRYFENKHRILTYLTAWYWSWLEYQVQTQTANMKDKKRKINTLIQLVMMKTESKMESDYINEYDLYQIILSESVKIYHGHRVSQDNKDQLFKPYKDLCACIGDILLEFNPKYSYPKSLASTIIEVSHCQVYFMHNLPLLTDCTNDKDENQIIAFLEHFVFSSLEKE